VTMCVCARARANESQSKNKWKEGPQGRGGGKGRGMASIIRDMCSQVSTRARDDVHSKETPPSATKGILRRPASLSTATTAAATAASAAAAHAVNAAPAPAKEADETACGSECGDNQSKNEDARKESTSGGGEDDGVVDVDSDAGEKRGRVRWCPTLAVYDRLCREPSSGSLYAIDIMAHAAGRCLRASM